MDEQMVKALLELGKITFEQISQRAAKIVNERQDPAESWLAVIPPEILQAYQGVHGHGANMAASRRMALVSELGEEKGAERFKYEAEDPSMVFLLAGLAPPIDPVEILFQSEVFVAGFREFWKAQKKDEHLSALALLSKIQKVREQYRASAQSGVTVPDQTTQ